MKKYIIAVVLMIFLIGCAPEQPVAPVVEPVVEVESPEDETSMEETAEPAVKEFNVRAFQFGYEPGTIEVNKGDKVIIRAYTSDVAHGMRIREFDFDLAIASKDPSNPNVAEFVADKEGEFTFSCSIPCGRGHKAMSGKLIVNP